MTRFPFGLIVLVVVSMLIYFGLAHRALDRLRLSERGALAVIAGIIIGSFINIPLAGGRFPLSINVGGGFIPLGLSIYLLVKAGSGREQVRSLIAAVITALVIYTASALLMRGLTEPGGRYEFLDSLWLYPLVAGLTAYLAGRTRRGAFIAATLGTLAIDAGYYFWLHARGAPAGRVAIGGAGAFDAVILSGLLAVMVAEVVGEIRERAAGGPAVTGRPAALLRGLRKPILQAENKTCTNEGTEKGGEK